ncbi:MAG: S8 family serine peptidase [Elusimicrobia bacterium]|nr:S8 family serine peptidase [Elusimicrobiota bacterium]
MKIVILSFALFTFSFTQAAENDARPVYHPYRILVKYKSDAVKKDFSLPSKKTSAFSQKGFSLSHLRKTEGDFDVYKFSSKMKKKDTDLVLEEIRKDPDVETAEPVYKAKIFAAPNDTQYWAQWHYHSSVSEAAGLNLPLAWDIVKGSPTINIAVIDTGILSHEDISVSRILGGYDMISDVDTANDGDGRDSNPSDPGDWCTAAEQNDSSSPCYSDPFYGGCAPSCTQNYWSSWHGLHVAGTIGAATNNNLGVAGIDWNAKIIPVRVLGKGGGWSDDIADGIRWAAGLPVTGASSNPNPARIINMSLGGAGPCPTVIQNAINAAVSAGALVVAAAGNSSSLASGFFPANCSNVISVAALNKNADLASYSNYGSAVYISAPGGESSAGNGVLSLGNNGVTNPGSDAYFEKNGTSMATPHVTGLSALMLAFKPNLTISEMTYNISKSARAFPAGSTICYGTSNCGAGIADAYNALNNLKTSVNSVSPNFGRNDGSVSITDLSGTGFLSGASVKLKRTGYADISAINVNVVNLNKITCDFPIGGASTGTWNIEVLNVDGSSATLSSAFNIIYPPPTVTSITPDNGVNTGDLTVTDLSGTGFINGASVKLSRVGYSEFSANSVNVVSSNKITCVLPLSGKEAGVWSVKVQNPDGQSFVLSDAFTIKLPPPSVSSISPSSATNNGVATINAIRGNNFSDNPSVRFTRSGYGDIYASNVTKVSVSTITCTININGAAAGFWNVVVRNSDGQEAVLNNGFEIKNLPPSLSSVYPNTAVNYGNMNIRITGSSFMNGISASLKKSGQSDIPCTGISLTGNYQINCLLFLSGKTAGAWDVYVANPDGQSALLPGAFVINNEAPYVDSLSANAAINSETFRLEIYGHGFLPGASVKLSKSGSVDINALTVSVASDKIICDLPLSSAAPGDWRLIVTNTDSQYSYYGDYFHIIAPAAEKTKIYGGIINPSQNEKAHITYKSSSSGKFSVKIYDQAGRLVMTVFEGSRSAGSYDDIWSGINESGKKVSSGVYFVEIETPEYKETKRILVLK